MKEKKGFRLNTHIILIIIFLLLVVVAVCKFVNWGEFIDQEELFKDGEGIYVPDTYDNMVPLYNEDGTITPLNTSDGLNIVLFGNAPFADDRGKENSLPAMIEELSGGTVYNCSISGSYAAAENSYLDPAYNPKDAFTFYWMSILACHGKVKDFYGQAVRILGDSAPPEALEVQKTLATLDFSEIDVIAVMYDATDYLLGRPVADVEDASDFQQFTTNIAAGLDLIQSTYPHIRIIVLSPAYAFADQIDENGEYISSDIYLYADHPLSYYAYREALVCAERSISFVDNIYNTFNEDNAKSYLTDNLHLNEAGRRKIAERFNTALFYYGSK